MDDPPPEDHPITQDAMDTDPKNDQPTHESDDIMITGMAYQAPGNPIALSKHNAKEEFSAVDKGKWKVDLEGYAQFSAQEIHSGYLNHLHTSRDFEAGLVNPMKERFEVIQHNPLHKYISISRQVYRIW